jgi:osmoprotectant transport system ATP-binding protein
MIRLTNVVKTFDNGRTFAVNKVSLEVHHGETMVLLGTSGCGKTTTLKMINRLISITNGTIEVGGSNVMEQRPERLRRSIGYVFQGIGLFPHMTIGENVAIVLRLLGHSLAERKKRTRFLLELVSLDPAEFFDKYPEELSGGQQQRVGVARALAANPEYLLMDEPFGALDALTRDALQQQLLQLKKDLRKTIIFVTHDIIEALILADRITVMHEGRIEQIGTKKQILQQPVSKFVKNLFAKPAEQLQDCWSDFKE